MKSVTCSMACRSPLSLRPAGSRFCHRATCLIIFGKPTIALASDTALVEERHRSLAVILDSSWRWLSARERTVLSALAIFVGGFTREAAEAVANADLGVLAALAERSFIQRLPDARGGSRYQVHELVRHYALRSRRGRPPDSEHDTSRTSLSSWRVIETSWNTQIEPLWSNPIGADLANISRRNDVGLG